MIDPEKINDRLLTIEIRAQAILDDVADLRKGLGSAKIISKQQHDFKMITEKALLRRRKAIEKKINKRRDTI